MSSVSIALPEHLQLQSALIRLPTEIKHIIFSYCFTADGPIVDPVVACDRPEGEAVPKLGINVIQTCRRLYHEIDRRPLMYQNTFRFTTVDRVRCFLKGIGTSSSACVLDIEIDARRVHSDHPGIAREWLHYLAWGGGTWSKILGSLRVDAPNLKCLRLNFESWPSIPMFRIELWNLLRNMLSHVDSLERVIIVGASEGKGMAMREPWSPVHFVGGDDVGPDDLVQRMWNTVKEVNSSKIIRWERREGRLYLEVVSRAYLMKHVDRHWTGPHKRENHTDAWPENGSCTWSLYQNRNEPNRKTINPNAVG
jgi:hypothetical protein